MKLQEIVSERDQAKAKWEEHERQALHFKELYTTLDVLVRLKGGKEAPFRLEPSNSNGSAAERPKKEIVAEIVKELDGPTAAEVREEFKRRGVFIKRSYVYNLLSQMTQSGALRRDDGRYYEN